MQQSDAHVHVCDYFHLHFHICLIYIKFTVTYIFQYVFPGTELVCLLHVDFRMTSGHLTSVN
jgi:hypothetical protein